MTRGAPSPRIRQLVVGGGIALGGSLAIDFGRTNGLTIGEPLALEVLGAALVALGVALRIWAFIGLRNTWRIDHLVTTGVYARTRNPIYLSFMVAILGIAFLFDTWLGFIWAAASIAVLYQLARIEETDLEKAFGDEYRQYRESVPRFLPWMRRD